ncbi:CD320 antigen [Choloepus didactylus]|uniref:CD320 antigen n=1 Tax=Choloepus didactylus TaxID=27675 RepID=UPI00189E9C65|nr:CD320 antigen [Choloepus didactylus]
MEPGRARRTAALSLALRLLLGLRLGLEAAPTPAGTPALTPTRTRLTSPARASGPSTASCPPIDFQCRPSGLCVPLSWRCDGDLDCPDGSDEDECRIEPCVQDGWCPPPTDSVSDCPGHNCSPQPCPGGQLRCRQHGACIPRTWRCDGHPDCRDASDEQGCGTTKAPQRENATSMGISATHENVTYLRNATITSVGDQGSVQSGNRSVYGVMATAVVLSAGLTTATFLVLCRLCTQGRLVVSMKESLQRLERKTSLV